VRRTVATRIDPACSHREVPGQTRPLELGCTSSALPPRASRARGSSAAPRRGVKTYPPGLR